MKTEMHEKHNPLLNRKEIELAVSEAVPPSMEAAKKIVAEKFSTGEENVHIEKVKGKFGSNHFIIMANIYPSSSERERFHIINKKDKKAASPAK